MGSIDKFGRKLGVVEKTSEPGPRGLPGPAGPGLLIDKDGHYSAQNHRIKTLKDPEERQDAVTKFWVEKNFVASKNPLSIGNKRITDVAPPTAGSDVVTMGWIEEKHKALRAELGHHSETIAGGAKESVDARIGSVEKEVAHLKSLLTVTASKSAPVEKSSAPAAGGAKKPT